MSENAEKDDDPPSTQKQSMHWFFGWALVLCLVVTLALGVWLRWMLAGWLGLGSFRFAHLKHAHSHLGYFGVVFPLLFVVWGRQGRFVLSPVGRWVYTAAVLLSFGGFVRAGYVVDSIIGSTIVGATWLVAAWKLRSWRFHTRSWAPMIAPGIVLASCCIPPIAIYTRRDPLFAQELVQTYLSTLLFLVAIPGLAGMLRIPPPHAGLWLLSGLVGALFLGVYPAPWLGIGLLLMALLLQWSIKSMFSVKKPRTQGLELVLATWLCWTLGLVLMGLQVLPNRHHISVAGIHFTLLGPIVFSGWYLFAQSTMSMLLTSSYLVCVVLMCAAIAAQQLMPHRLWPLVTAISGTGILLVALTWVLVWWKKSR